MSVAPVGEPFVESGPSDRIGKPLGTIPRLTETLDGIGYRAAVSKRPAPGGGVTLVVALTPYDRVRYVFVKGNWPIRQDEIQRRITIRPGRPLPPPGAERTTALDQERARILDFLRNEGYFEATVRLEARPGARNPRAVDLYVDIDKGPSYPLGPITLTGNRALPTDEIDPMFRHAAWYYAWLRPVPFTQKQLRLDIEALEKRYRELGYFGVRVTTDFSMQKSLDRVAKNVRLAIQVNERKKITVAFEGNSQVSSSTLRDELTLLTRGSYDDFEVGASADAIQRHYQADGHFFARVEWRRERLSADEERVIFTIDEGPQLRVRGIDFAGNKSLLRRASSPRSCRCGSIRRSDWERAATSPASRWSRTSSASSSTTSKRDFSRSRRAPRRPRRRRRWARSARSRRAPTPSRATPGRSSSATRSRRARG